MSLNESLSGFNVRFDSAAEAAVDAAAEAANTGGGGRGSSAGDGGGGTDWFPSPFLGDK